MATTEYRMDVKVAVYEPGNGSRYLIVTGVTEEGEPFVAIPNHNKAAVMGLTPVEWTYVAEKLRLGEADARAVLAYLKGEEFDLDWWR